MRTQIGTVEITRRHVYALDPWHDVCDPNAASVVVEPGSYPVYENGLTRYWRMTGHLNDGGGFTRMGDGMFGFRAGDEPGDDDVVFYSSRYGPDEWARLVTDCAAEDNPALIFRLDR